MRNEWMNEYLYVQNMVYTVNVIVESCKFNTPYPVEYLSLAISRQITSVSCRVTSPCVAHPPVIFP